MAKMAEDAVKRAAEAEKRAARKMKVLDELQEELATMKEKAKMVMTQQNDIITKQERTISKLQHTLLKRSEKRAESDLINGSNGMCFDNFMCPITHSLMKDPVITRDGHTYEREAIEKWFRMNNTSPLTGVALHDNTLVPNHAVRKAIEDVPPTEAYVPPTEAYVPPHKRC